MSTSNNFKCSEDFPTSDIVLGFLLSVGIFISFLPQIIVLIFRKNVEGLSVISCWFNYANCMGTFLNILFLNWFIFECCGNSSLRWMNSWVCFENLLPVVQMGVPFVTTGVIFALYVIYRPKLPPLSSIKNLNKQEDHGESGNNITKTAMGESVDSTTYNGTASSSSPLGDSTQQNATTPDSEFNGSGSTNSSGSSTPILPKTKKAEVSPDSFLLKQGNNRIERLFIRMDWYSQPFFWGTNIATIIFFVIGVALVYGYGSKSNQLEGYAFFLGVLAAILVFFQWMPQIYTTWIADEIGSLSLVSLCIQVPGALLVCYFQLSSNQSWITWFPYLATAIQESVLVVLCIYYLIRDRKKAKSTTVTSTPDDQQQQQQNEGEGERKESVSVEKDNQPEPENETIVDNSNNNSKSIGINNNDQDQSGGFEYYQSAGI